MLVTNAKISKLVASLQTSRQQVKYNYSKPVYVKLNALEVNLYFLGWL